MSRRVCIAVAIASLIHRAHNMRLRLERIPDDVLASFIRQENAEVCPLKGNLLALDFWKEPFEPGALVLTSERLLLYGPHESLLPSCSPLNWVELSTSYPQGRHFMYNHNGVLEKAEFDSAESFMVRAAPSGDWTEQRNIRYTPIKMKSLAIQPMKDPFENGKFYPYDPVSQKLPTELSVGCAYPEEAASIAIETITLRHNVRIHYPHRYSVVSGCPDAECKEKRVEWIVSCLFDDFDCFGISFDKAVVDAHLKKNEIKELLGLAIDRAIQSSRNKFANHPAFGEIATAFTQGIIPKKEDPNSRSGAAFFYSSDKMYIAKRIRDNEYNDGLLALAAHGMYSAFIDRGSTLCPTYVGFQSKGDTWIVMRREQLPSDITELFPPRRNFASDHSFFADIKPHPMVSDRLAFHNMLGAEFLTRGFNFANLHGWDDVVKTVGFDTSFLEGAGLVDYSFWIYGTLFDLDRLQQKDEWEKFMSDIMSGETGSKRRHPGCAYGCQKSMPNPLVDLTFTMGKDNRLQIVGDFVHDWLPVGHEIPPTTYKCCCAELSATTFKLESPCVLVDLDKATNEFMLPMNRTGCGNLLGQGWHSYYHNSLSHTNGKCLVGLGAQKLWASMPRVDEYIISPEQLWPDMKVKERVSVRPDVPWRCGVVCVSIGDYFLHLGAWEAFENVALTLWYRAQKWTDYREKMLRQLQSLQGSPPFGDDFAEAISSGMTLALQDRVLPHALVANRA